MQIGTAGFTVPYEEDWDFDSSNINCPDFSQKQSWIKKDVFFKPSSQPKVIKLPKADQSSR